MNTSGSSSHTPETCAIKRAWLHNMHRIFLCSKTGRFCGTVWRVIIVGSNFRGKSEKALKINFRGFKFRHSNQPRGMALLHKR